MNDGPELADSLVGSHHIWCRIDSLLGQLCHACGILRAADARLNGTQASVLTIATDDRVRQRSVGAVLVYAIGMR